MSDLLLEEKDKRITGLGREIGNLDRFTHYFAEKKQISERLDKKKWWNRWRS